MASFTSNVTFGYWSDPASWLMDGNPATRAPKEGDSVTIQSGHTIVFDTDMSGFPNGLSGLTINGTLLIPSLDDPSYSEVGEETSGTPWLSGWSYRRTVYVDNSFSSTALTDFQVIIFVNTAYLIAKGKMRQDCGDIRVTDADGNLLPIWIDPETKGLWNTKVYVKVPSIPANSVVTLYLFYGNLDATDISDGNSVFDFFDDFSGTSLDENKWTAARWTGTGSWSVTVGNGYVEINSGSSTRAGIVSKTAFPLPFIIDGSWRYVSGDEMWTSITQTNGGSHSDLVEFGYDEQHRSAGDASIRFYYRKASGGSYSNYQYFNRYAPRESFTRFMIEWLTNAGRYHEWDIRLNSTTTQDRYTSGSCYVQLSTINGVAQWDWIAVRKYASTPPAVYFRTLTWTALKVNANIAGAGTLQIGSESYAITYPQKAQIIMNGTIQPTYFKAYGETRRTWDWFEQDATVSPPRFYLKNGIPLRKGDILVALTGDPVYVLDYDPSTRTVKVARSSWNRTGERRGFPRVTLYLITRTIDILKFGSNNVYYAAGTNFVFIGVFFTRLPLFQPSASAGGGNLTSPTFKYCSNYRMTANDYDGIYFKTGGGTLLWQWCAGDSAGSPHGWVTGMPSSATCVLEDCLFHNPRYGLTFAGNNTWRRCIIHKGAYGIQGHSSPNPGSLIEDCVFIDAPTNYCPSWIKMINCKLVNSAGVSGLDNYFENLQIYNDSANRGYIASARSVFKNVQLHLNSTHANILLSGARQCRLYNVSVYSYANAPFLSLSNDVWADNIIDGLTVSGTCHVRLMGNPTSDYNISQGAQMLGRFVNLSVPVLSNAYGNIPGGGIVYHPVGYWNVEQLTVNSMYNRAAVHNTRWDARFGSIVRLVSSVRISGLTVGTVQYPNALEFIGFHGWAKNRWDTAQPDYQTFDFYLNPTVAGYYGTLNMGPIIAWWVFKGLSPIMIAGTITQLGTNEKVKVEIYRYPKEPLFGDTSEFQQEFTEVGSFAITWTPPDDGTWVARILAFLWQTTNPITIENLQVTSLGGSGGGGGEIVNIQVNDQMGLLASESVQTQLAIQPLIDAAIIGAEQVHTDVLTTIDDTASLTSIDAAMAQFSLLPTELVQITASETINQSLQTSILDSIAALTEDAVVANMALAPSETVRVSTSEQVSSEISFALAQNEQLLASEDVNLFSGLQLVVNDAVQVVSTESQISNIAMNLIQQERISAFESLSTQIEAAVSDQIRATTTESVSPSILPQVSDTTRVTASEHLSASLQVTAQAPVTIRATDSSSPIVQVSAVDQEVLSTIEAGSVAISAAVSESMRIAANEQPAAHIQISVVESVTQIEAETDPFVGLIQRLMVPVSIDLLRSVELNITITQVSLELGID